MEGGMAEAMKGKRAREITNESRIARATELEVYAKKSACKKSLFG